MISCRPCFCAWPFHTGQNCDINTARTNVLGVFILAIAKCLCPLYTMFQTRTSPWPCYSRSSQKSGFWADKQAQMNKILSLRTGWQVCCQSPKLVVKMISTVSDYENSALFHRRVPRELAWKFFSSRAGGKRSWCIGDCEYKVRGNSENVFTER